MTIETEALIFPKDHPAVSGPSGVRQPAWGLNMHDDTKIIEILDGGWIDGPCMIGAGWTIVPERDGSGGPEAIPELGGSGSDPPRTGG